MLSIVPVPCLAERTTLRLGGTALAEVTLTEEADLPRLEETCARLGGTPYVLGAGSNILARDGELPLVLVRPRFLEQPVIVGEENDVVLVRVGGGVRLPRLLGQCAARGLSGLEGLCGIPGTVGGAVAMNAGSFDCVTGERLHSLRVYSPLLGVKDISKAHFSYKYRRFSITGINSWFLVLQATFGLTHSLRSGITGSMRRNFFKKKSIQPISAWSAGCVFKNPSAENPAGKLLDAAGFKGKRLGGMAFSELHANFLINEGTGSVAAALELMEQAREAVRRRFNIILEPEVRIVPWPLS